MKVIGLVTWRRDTSTVFVLYKLDTILDVNYVIPMDVTSTQFAIFTKSNILVFTVLKKNVLTDNGQRIINKHNIAKDSRSAWLELVDFYEKNFNAKNCRLPKTPEADYQRQDGSQHFIFQKLVTHNSYCEHQADVIEGRRKLNYFRVISPPFLISVGFIQYLTMEACEKKAHQLHTRFAEQNNTQHGMGSNAGSRRRLNVNSTLITDQELYGDSLDGLSGARGSDDYGAIHANQAQSDEYVVMLKAFMTEVLETHRRVTRH